MTTALTRMRLSMLRGDPTIHNMSCTWIDFFEMPSNFDKPQHHEF